MLAESAQRDPQHHRTFLQPRGPPTPLARRQFQRGDALAAGPFRSGVRHGSLIADSPLYRVPLSGLSGSGKCHTAELNGRHPLPDKPDSGTQ